MSTTPEFGAWAQRRLVESSGKSLKASEPAIFAALQERLDELLTSLESVRMLDAGCGKRRAVPIARTRFVVGIDISRSQVEKNPDVDEGIVGDVQTYQFEPTSFDAVVCWNVLEHLEDPRQALLSFERALKPGGLLIIALPHVRSIKGVVTRYTPFWFHKLVWSGLLGAKPEFEPFPTVMSSTITPRRLKEFADERGLCIEYFAMYESWQQRSLRSRVGLNDRTFKLVTRAVKTLSRGTVTAEVTDVAMVMSKQCP